jgi:heme-degrading monooxygenase HmoA
MTYARVGIYSHTGTTLESEITRQVAEGLLPIFKRQPGFVDYNLVAADGKLISISFWESMEQAQAGTKQAATWVAEKLGSQVTLDTNFVGDVVLSSHVLATS